MLLKLIRDTLSTRNIMIASPRLISFILKVNAILNRIPGKIMIILSVQEKLSGNVKVNWIIKFNGKDSTGFGMHCQNIKKMNPKKTM